MQSLSSIVLTIAGSDSGAGAGIQADLKTLAALGVYGCSAITAVTAQNTRRVSTVHSLPPALVREQMETVFEDMPVAAVKTGMLANAGIVRAVAAGLTERSHLPLVLDPVMVSSSGQRLLDEAAVDTLLTHLLPRATLLTPNRLEAAALLGCRPATSLEQAHHQAAQLLALGPAGVLLKGGHDHGGEVIDLLMTPAGAELFRAPRLHTPNTHGTGCTLAAAIAAGLARGLSMSAAVNAAHRYLQRALERGSSLRVGGGHGPVHHFHAYY